jgi:hypothetical protein
MRFVKTLLILSHRYIGIPLSFMFVLWFVSAFFMIYTGGMPRITPAMQADGAEPIDFSSVTLTPEQAMEAAGFAPPNASLRTILQRPVYEFREPGYGSTFIYADTGAAMARLDEQQSAQLAASFLEIPVEQLTFAGSLSEVDQWTLTSSADLPLYKFTADDGLGTEVYVSPDKAIVSVYTTSRSRMLAWFGTIPHWLYFTSLRMNQPLWYDIIVWSSGIGCVMAALGLCLGVTQWRRLKPFSLKRAIPYQGLMRWHYILGVVFGVFTLTWVFSGLLSMEPFAWTTARSVAIDGDVYAEGELDLAAYPPLNSLAWKSFTQNEIKQIDFNWIQGEPYLLANYSVPTDSSSVKRDRLHQPYNIAGQSEAQSLLVNASTGTVSPGFDVEQMVAKLDASVTDASVTEYTLLDSYDDYYYSRQSQLPLPVLRIKFDDPVTSWVYVDPDRSELLTAVNKWSRLERWLYNGLHSLDFAFWYHQRPLWDIGVIVLLLGGLGTSLIGLYFGLRRLNRDVQTLISKLRNQKPAKEVVHATH